MEKNNLSIFEEERSQILKGYERNKIYNKSIVKLSEMICVSFIISFITNILLNHFRKYIPEQILSLAVIAVAVIYIIVLIVSLSGDTKNVKNRISFVISILYGIIMPYILNYDIIMILLKVGFMLLVSGVILISIKKLKRDYIAFVIILIFVIFILQNTNLKPADNSTFVFCANICFFYLVQREFKEKLFSQKIENFEENYMPTVRLFIFILGAFLTLF